MTTSESRRLLELALHLRMHGECAPGGHETWAQFDTDLDHHLRDLPRPPVLVHDCARDKSVVNPFAPAAGVDAVVGELWVAVEVAYDRFCQREHARGGHRRDDMMAALIAALPHLFQPTAPVSDVAASEEGSA